MMMRMFTDLYDLEDAYFAGRVDLKTYLNRRKRWLHSAWEHCMG